MTAQARDDGVRAPVAEGSGCPQALALAAATAQAGHLGVDVSLVEEHQPMRLLAHAGLALGRPDPTLLTNVGACALRRHQRFFYM